MTKRTTQIKWCLLETGLYESVNTYEGIDIKKLSRGLWNVAWEGFESQAPSFKEAKLIAEHAIGTQIEMMEDF